MTNVDTKDKDCLACRIIGTVGLFGISVYVFMDAFKHPKKSNRIFLNTLGTGRFLIFKEKLSTVF